MLPTIALLATRTGWHTDQLRDAIQARGFEPRIMPWEANVGRMGKASGVINEEFMLAGSRAVLPRIIPNGSLEQIIYRVDTLHRLESQGVRVMNSPRAIERSVDKAWASALLEQAGLATPETVVCERIDDAFSAFRAMGDVVVKPLFGSMGLGMTRVNDEDVAFRVFRAVEMARGVFYLQKFVPHQGVDIRAFVIGDRVVGAIERSAPGWKTNVARGGVARTVTLSPALVDIAIKAAKAVGAEYAGVDLLPGNDGTVYVIEVNGIPGWRGLQEATGLNVAGAIVEQLLK